MIRSTIALLLSLLFVLILSSNSALAGRKPELYVKQTDCQGLSIIVTDSVDHNDWLADIELLRDSSGIYTTPGLMSYNVDWDPTEPIDYVAEPVVAFGVRVLDPFQPAFAAIWVASHNGDTVIYEWHYTPPPVSISAVSLTMLSTPVGSDSCITFTLTNTGSTPMPYDKIQPGTSGEFRVTSVLPADSGVLASGASLTVSLCYHATDTNLVTDKLTLPTSYCNIPLYVSGSGMTGIIDASDVSYNGIDIGASDCRSVRVYNRGNGPMHVSAAASAPFQFSSTIQNDLIPANSYKDYSLCFTPAGNYGHYMEDIVWTTDQASLYHGQIKPVTHVIGIASPAGLHWDRVSDYYDPANGTADTLRFTIFNTARTARTFTGLQVAGQSAAEFAVIDTPTATSLQPHDSLAVLIAFQPNLNLGFATRYAQVYIMSNGAAVDTLSLAGYLPQLSVPAPNEESGVRIYPNPVTGGTLHVSLGVHEARSISIFNIRGEAVWNSIGAPIHDEVELATTHLVAGVYFLRVESEEGVITKRFVIEK